MKLGKGVESYQYLSRPNPTDIFLAISSGLLGSTFFVNLVSLDDDPSFGVVYWSFVPTCMVHELGG